MKKYFIPATGAAILVSLGITSCETPPGYATGTGAALGAASGALIGAGAGGGRGAAIGLGAGLLAGALVGAAVDAENARNYQAPPGGYPFARPTGTSGYAYSPYGQHKSSMSGASRPERWCATPRPAEFSASLRPANESGSQLLSQSGLVVVVSASSFLVGQRAFWFPRSSAPAPASRACSLRREVCASRPAPCVTRHFACWGRDRANRSDW